MLVLRLRKLGATTYRTYVIDDTAFVVPAGSKTVQQTAILNRVQELINHAITTQSTVVLPLRGSPRPLRIDPSRYKMITTEWDDE